MQAAGRKTSSGGRVIGHGASTTLFAVDGWDRNGLRRDKQAP